MVDSRRDEVMADRIDHLTERVQVVEEKVSQLAATMSAGFQAIDEAFRDQREYTEFCFTRLEQKIDARLGGMDARLEGMGAHFDDVGGRLDRIERKLDQFIDVQIRTNDLVERRLRRLE